MNAEASSLVARLRADFPILSLRVGDRSLVYFDNAATMQKPSAVIAAMQRFYMLQNANIHRGVHYLSQEATDAYEESRRKVARFLNAPSEQEVVFVRGATEAINLAAHGLARVWLREGDEILLTMMEHHANIVPWQVAAEQTGARIVVAGVTPEGALDLDHWRSQLGSRTKIAAMVHASNALGTINPVARMVAEAKALGAVTLVDASQSVAHFPVDVQAIGADFTVFSGHKVVGPTGIGVLHGTSEWLRRLPPYQTGGDMIAKVSFSGTTYREAPEKFEAGTPNIAGAVGLGAAVDYLTEHGREALAVLETDLLDYATPRLREVPGLKLYGDVPHKVGVLSFTLDGVHPHDIGTILDHDGIAIRAGHHCAQPLMKHYGIPGTARASLAFYNTREEVEALVQSLHRIAGMFS